MRLVAIALALVACKKDPPAELTPVAPLPAPVVAPAPVKDLAPVPVHPGPHPEGLDALIQAFSARDAGPTCVDAEALVPDPVKALTYLVNYIPMPPQAPMRAATCLVDRHPEVAADDLVRWVTGDETKGLGLLVLQRLDTLPEPIAVRVATAAITGPLTEEATVAIRGASRDAVKTVAPVAP